MKSEILNCSLFLRLSSQFLYFTFSLVVNFLYTLNLDYLISHLLINYFRKLQKSVDKLEAEKDTLVNYIYDLRLLLKKVNSDGDNKVEYLRKKQVNKLKILLILQVTLKAKIAGLHQSLHISRQNVSFFEEVANYWTAVVHPTYCCYGKKDSYCGDSDCGNCSN